jgi:hypothetical protein
MNEIEKRSGLTGPKSDAIKEKISQHYSTSEVIRRTILVAIQGDSFTTDPNTLLDLKVKLMDDKTLFAAKYGSWHGGTSRQEYEINFDRHDLADIIGFLSILNHRKFVLLSTQRTVWRPDDLMITLDEYRGLDHSLLEIEAVGHEDEQKIDEAFAMLGVMPMTSQETIKFVNQLNHAPGVQIDLATTSPEAIARKMVQLHT